MCSWLRRAVEVIAGPKPADDVEMRKSVLETRRVVRRECRGLDVVISELSAILDTQRAAHHHDKPS